eukprot:3655117-Prymnesium_polylepis.1
MRLGIRTCSERIRSDNSHSLSQRAIGRRGREAARARTRHAEHVAAIDRNAAAADLVDLVHGVVERAQMGHQRAVLGGFAPWVRFNREPRRARTDRLTCAAELLPAPAAREQPVHRKDREANGAAIWRQARRSDGVRRIHVDQLTSVSALPCLERVDYVSACAVGGAERAMERHEIRHALPHAPEHLDILHHWLYCVHDARRPRGCIERRLGASVRASVNYAAVANEAAVV